ncbi:MAG: amidohydrolase family protein, partial [Ignavibacteriaceae bacterium]|nr:amidohydrolase family protein [Ignavibacteriaceae bacterium]
MKSLVTIIILFYFIVGCSTNQNEKADTVFTNGFVYTVDSINSKAEAVAVKDKAIIFVGDNESVQNYIGENTKVINLNGKMVLPGFVDAHCHSISSYRYFNELNLYGLKSKEDIQNAIKKYLFEHPDAKYIKGRGWSDTDFPGIGPDKKIIDEIVKDIPVSFSSDGGHSKWVNSKTLELAGMNNSTKNPKGGIIERYPGTNEPNGTLRENASDLVADIFPAYTVENLMDGLEAYQRMVSAFGITTVHDAYLDA